MNRKQLAAHAAALLPILTVDLGYDPLDPLTDFTGQMAVYLALASLAVSPLKKFRLATMRRPLGLWAFAYGFMHLMVYVLLDFNLEDLTKPVFLIGIAVLLMWLPLAVTSNQRAMRYLRQSWKKLHRLVYPAAILALVHWTLSVKIVPLEVYGWWVVLLTLLIWRRL